jgi:hypothetical protein
MARSKAQIENSLRVVVVSALAKEFRKAQIIKRIIAIAKEKDLLASGDLINPQKSKSLTPVNDESWLLDRNSVRLSLINFNEGMYDGVEVSIKIEYGIDKKYYSHTIQSGNSKKWYPPIGQIKRWIVQKSNRGMSFEKDGTPINLSDDSKLTGLAIAIAKKLKKNGHKKTNLINPFFYKRNGVEATIQKAKAIYEPRIYEITGEVAYTKQEDIFLNNLV